MFTRHHFLGAGVATTGKLLEHLRAAGFQPGDIDTVLITHHHGDHIGGLRNKAGEFVFQKAKALVPAPEHLFWMADGKMAAAPKGMKGAFNNARRVFAQMPADMLVRFDPGGEVAPGIRSAPRRFTPWRVLSRKKTDLAPGSPLISRSKSSPAWWVSVSRVTKSPDSMSTWGFKFLLK